MGYAPQAIRNRIARGEPVDVVIIVGDALDGLIKQGRVIPDSRVDVARSGIGMAARKGAPKPDISSLDALKRTLLQAKSIAYSDGASGIYLSTVLVKRFGIADEIKDKSRMIPADPVGGVVASGEYENRISANQRVEASTGYRHRRGASAGGAKDDGVLGRHRCRREGTAGCGDVDQFSLLTRHRGRHHQERNGASDGGARTVIAVGDETFQVTCGDGFDIGRKLRTRGEPS